MLLIMRYEPQDVKLRLQNLSMLLKDVAVACGLLVFPRLEVPIINAAELHPVQDDQRAAPARITPDNNVALQLILLVNKYRFAHENLGHVDECNETQNV